MIEFSWVHLGFLMLAGFVGSFIDAIVGGGGLITLPAWMATGLPMAYALGSTKWLPLSGPLRASPLLCEADAWIAGCCAICLFPSLVLSLGL